jgi:autonomous glycyl radical cofactor GrcA
VAAVDASGELFILDSERGEAREVCASSVFLLSY